MLTSTKHLLNECFARYPALRSVGMRSSILFGNFFLINMSLYQLKPASRSLFIDSLGVDRLPYVWIGTALTMGVFIALYHPLVSRYSRLHVVLASCLFFGGLLFFFRVLFINSSNAVSVAFYIYVDILGVVLVEQFWSLTNSVYTTNEGKKWYGLIGTGGLVGGALGGGAAALMIQYTPLKTLDLLIVAAMIILLIFFMTWIMGRVGIYCEVKAPVQSEPVKGGWRALGHSRYLVLIAIILLIAQIASQLIEYQFLKTVEMAYVEQDARTTFLSTFFSVMSFISIGVNLGLTPFIQRHLGVIAGLLIQPVMITLCSWGFLLHPSLRFGMIAKISDKGLSYSINRVSRELLYVPINPILIYQAKAWIDMVGYRVFKIFGSLLILLMTQWLPITLSIGQMSWFTMFFCTLWIGLIIILRQDYRVVSEQIDLL